MAIDVGADLRARHRVLGERHRGLAMLGQDLDTLIFRVAAIRLAEARLRRQRCGQLFAYSHAK